MRMILALLVCMLLWSEWVFSQATVVNGLPPEPTPPVDTAPRAEKKKTIRERIKEYEELRAKSSKRIHEIDALLEPAKEALVEKVFEIPKQEYQMLKLQAQVPEAAKKFFAAKNVDVTTSRENIANYLDGAYESIKVGILWYGQEQTLIQQDVNLYNKMQEELTKALLEGPKGEQYKALLAEKSEIYEGIKTVDPILLYHIERKNWFKSFPDYKQTLEDAALAAEEAAK